MRLPKDDAETLSARWIEGVLLKRDVFSSVERGRFRNPAGEVDAVLRRLDAVPWWSYLVARHLFARERRALARPQQLRADIEAFGQRQRLAFTCKQMPRQHERPPRHLIEPAQHRINLAAITAEPAALDV